MAQPHARVRSELRTKVPADLLRTPPMRQLLHHHPPQVTAGLDTPRMVAGATSGRTAMRSERPVAAATTSGIPAKLTRDRRWSSTQPLRDHPHAQSRVPQLRDLNAFVLREKSAADLTNRQAVDRRYEPDQLTHTDRSCSRMLSCFPRSSIRPPRGRRTPRPSDARAAPSTAEVAPRAVDAPDPS